MSYALNTSRVDLSPDQDRPGGVAVAVGGVPAGLAPAYTTMTCSECGARAKRLPLSQRTFACDQHQATFGASCVDDEFGLGGYNSSTWRDVP